MALSEAACRAAKGRNRPYKLTDGHGLYLQVQPSGSRLWRMAYRFGGKQKTLAFGAWPAVTVGDARARRDAAKKVLAGGVDPGEVRRAASTPGELAFEVVARRWHENEKSAWVPAHVTRVLSRLERDVFPAIGQRPISAIEAPEILDLLRAVEARGALDISKRLRQSIGAVFRFAIAEGKATRNPAADVGDALKPKPKPRHFAALRAADIPEFMKRLAAYDGERLTMLAILLVLHTFVRTSEMRFAAWPEFELGGPAPLWRIPKERMKMGREHLVPLTPQTVSIIEEIRTINGGDRYLFPGAQRNVVMSQNAMIFALYRMGYHSRLTIHGLRGTASTILNEHGFAPDWIERQLAHVEGNEIRGAYNAAEWLPGRREMMNWWSNFIDAQRAAA